MIGESVQKITVDSELAGQRVDNFLITLLKGLPKSRVYRIIRKGEVRINGRRCKPQSRLAAGDEVRVPPIRDLRERSVAVGHFDDLDALILCETEHLLVINKPAGMAVHGGSGQSVGVIESLRHARPEDKYLELVHRLDRATSGCLMIAKRRRYLKALQDALRRPGTIQKDYLALVHGRWPEHTRAVDQPILTTNRSGKERISRISEEGKAALTAFRVMSATDEVSLIQASPRTGRTHQIRVHTRWARHPIVGDERYGDELLDGMKPPARMMLHAARLTIPALDGHPAQIIEAPLDDAYQGEVNSRLENINNIIQ